MRSKCDKCYDKCFVIITDKCCFIICDKYSAADEEVLLLLVPGKETEVIREWSTLLCLQMYYQIFHEIQTNVL